MNLDQINYLNIGLMLLSLVAAFILPFEVFLLSYAILGPLHYLTEISWLHDRQYFAPRKLDWIPLTVLGILILLGARSIMGKEIYGALEAIGLGGMVKFLGTYGYDITFLAFGMALIFVATKDWTYRIAALILLLFCGYLFHIPDPIIGDQGMTEDMWQRKVVEPYSDKWNHPVFKLFGVYVPTLIHVYCFTGIFIIYGALKSRSRSGYVSFAVFLLCAIACFVILPGNPGINLAGDWAQNHYSETFSQLSMHLMEDFGGKQYEGMLVGSTFGDETQQSSISALIFNDPLSIMFARFIAFAYTYHYLNWFSKTSVIKWHKVPKLRFVMVLVAWVASVALYMYNYQIGFRWLFLLSFLHVMLEFPLNHQSFIGIGKELRGMMGGQKVSTAK